MVKKSVFLLLAVSLLLFGVSAVEADIVKMKNGNWFEGEIIEDTGSSLRIRVDVGIVEFRKAEIYEIVSDEKQVYREDSELKMEKAFEAVLEPKEGEKTLDELLSEVLADEDTPQTTIKPKSKDPEVASPPDEVLAMFDEAEQWVSATPEKGVVSVPIDPKTARAIVGDPSSAIFEKEQRRWEVKKLDEVMDDKLNEMKGEPVLKMVDVPDVLREAPSGSITQLTPVVLTTDVIHAQQGITEEDLVEEEETEDEEEEVSAEDEANKGKVFYQGKWVTKEIHDIILREREVMEKRHNYLREKRKKDDEELRKKYLERVKRDREERNAGLAKGREYGTSTGLAGGGNFGRTRTKTFATSSGQDDNSQASSSSNESDSKEIKVFGRDSKVVATPISSYSVGE